MGEISISSEAAMLTSLPAAGLVKLFINTDKSNILYYVDSNGNFSIYNANDTSALEECCSCIIAKQWMDRVTCALNGGLLNATQFGTVMAQGLSVISTETINPETGAKTCRVDIGPKTNIPIISVTISGEKERTLSIGQTTQLSVVVLPAEAPQGVIWISSNPTKAAVTQSGLVVGVSAGIVAIQAVSQVDGTKLDIATITVS